MFEHHPRHFQQLQAILFRQLVHAPGEDPGFRRLRQAGAIIRFHGPAEHGPGVQVQLVANGLEAVDRDLFRVAIEITIERGLRQICAPRKIIIRQAGRFEGVQQVLLDIPLHYFPSYP